MASEPTDRRMIGALLRIPREAALRQVVAGLEVAGFGDVRPAHFTVFQHMPLEGIRLTGAPNWCGSPRAARKLTPRSARLSST
jgi:hypothetical protein